MSPRHELRHACPSCGERVPGWAQHTLCAKCGVCAPYVVDAVGIPIALGWTVIRNDDIDNTTGAVTIDLYWLCPACSHRPVPR